MLEQFSLFCPFCSQSNQFLTAVQTAVPSSKGSVSTEMRPAVCCPGAGLLGGEEVGAASCTVHIPSTFPQLSKLASCEF